MSEITCPNCAADLSVEMQGVLPDYTDITLTLHIEHGQLCMAKTIAGVIENFAAMQEAVADSLDCDVSVFMADLKYEDDVIYLTFRIANAARGQIAASAGGAGTAATTEIGAAEGEHAVAKPDAQKEHP